MMLKEILELKEEIWTETFGDSQSSSQLGKLSILQGFSFTYQMKRKQDWPVV